MLRCAIVLKPESLWAVLLAASLLTYFIEDALLNI